MKQLFISSALLFAMQTSAFAQSSATVITPAPANNAAAANASAGAATSTAEAAPSVQPVSVKYLGIFEGPSFSTEQAGKNMHNEDETISNRPAVQYNVNANTNFGIQPRFSTTFKTTGLEAANEMWRLYGTFKNVASYGILSLDIIPRIQLPTTIAAHNKTMTLSPDLIMALNITPKNSRFNFDYTPELLGYFYTNDAAATSANAKTFIILHSFEGTYQLTSKSQLTFGWYPEYNVSKTLPFTQDSNEVDVGVNFDVAKGWSLNPYIGVEPVGMKSDNIGKSMEAALVVNGTFL